MFPSVTPLYDMGVGAGSLWCRKVQEAGDFCRCLFKGPRERGEMERLASVYNERVLEVVREWQGRTREAPILEERFRGMLCCGRRACHA